MSDAGPAIPARREESAARHVSVCVCTYRRPQLLLRCLSGLAAQSTQGRFRPSIVVCDNDVAESARSTVADFAATAPIRVRYCVEPRQNIALARNRAVEHATGELVAFIDDDEEPSPDWLVRLFEAIELYGADGVLGPVMPRFLTPPPEWIQRGGFFARPSPPSGTWLHWKQTRTGNALLRREVFDDAVWFREECGDGGEDVDFFRRMIAKGRRFVWCAEARVSEAIPPERCTRGYLLQRALRRGKAPTNQRWEAVAASLLAAPVYAVALPVLALFGQHVFMRYLIKECDHLGRLYFALFGRGR